MRFYLILLFFFACALTTFAEDYAKIFTKGYQFYLRGDYPSAIEMFKQIPKSQHQLYEQSLFYLGSIYAYQGDKKAFEILKEAVTTTLDISMRRTAFNAFARYCIANKKYKEIVDVSAMSLPLKLPKGNANAWIGWQDSENSFYIAQASFCLGDKKYSKLIINAILQKDFNDVNSIGVDMFIDSWLSGDDFTKDLDLFVLEKNIKTQTPAGLARLSILQKKPITQSQKDISFFAQIILAEQDAKLIDKKLFEEEIYKNRNVPFAWQGALILGKIYFNQKNYDRAILCAQDCIKLSSPEIMSSWQGIMLLADCYRLQKKYQLALDEYKKIYMNKRSRGEPVAESMYKSGLCYFEQGQWADAHAYFQRVFVVFFRYEYWGSRAYYYDAQCLYSLKQRRDANATLLEYFRRAKDRNSKIYKEAKKYYDQI